MSSLFFVVQVMAFEFNRGWNSRLGFSLKLDEVTGRTYISAIYNDSVAARDGRLRIGDHIIKVSRNWDLLGV